MSAKDKKSAIIVGCGIGGVSVAARLSQAGYDVTVFEKEGHSGGRCSLIEKNGYRFDQGPSLLLLPKLFEETFNDLGTSLKAEGVDIRKCEPNYNIHFKDGSHMELSTDLTRMKAEIEQYEGLSGFANYLAFLQEAGQHYDLSVEHVLHRNFYSLLSLFRWGFLKSVMVLHPFVSIYSRASKYFRTERLRRAFTFAAMYMGMSPMDAPGTYSLLQYTELTEGIFYPIGGFHKVVQALEAIAKRNGVKFHYNSPVKRVITSNNTATGVELEDDTTHSADLVVVNADLVYAYSNLLPDPKSRYSSSLTKRESSCSSISFYWSLDRIVPELGIHNIFLADHYAESFDSIFKKHAMPDEASYYVNVPSRIDSSAAPEGKDAVVVLVPVGHITQGEKAQDFKKMVNDAREQVLSGIESRLGVKDFRSWIVEEQINDPVSWRDKFNLDKGSILGLSHSFFNVLAFRPRTKHSSIENCYFVGASAHPGTGVPIVMAGAKMTSEQILQEQGDSLPWPTWKNNLSGSETLPTKGWSQNILTLLAVLACIALLMQGLPLVKAGV